MVKLPNANVVTFKYEQTINGISKTFKGHTLFPHIVSAELFFSEFGKAKGHSASREETIQGQKLFKGGNFMRKYGR